jgi:hypothetical protein
MVKLKGIIDLKAAKNKIKHRILSNYLDYFVGKWQTIAASHLLRNLHLLSESKREIL